MSPSSYFEYWGKAKPAGPSTAPYHLLPYHSLDVAACAQVLLQRDGNLLRRIGSAAGAVLGDELVAVIVFLHALHDLGKFSDRFQGVAPAAVAALQPTLVCRDYTVRHDTLGFALWGELAQSLIHDGLLTVTVDGRRLGALDARDHLDPWMRALTGHHGAPPRPERAQRHFHAPAIDAARAFVADCAQLLAPLHLELEGAGFSALRRSSWLLAGLAVLADWLGSWQRYFPYVAEPMPLGEYWPLALERAAEAVRAAEVLPPPPATSLQPSALFPHVRELTPLQALARDVPLFDGPQLFLLEDLTGAGKTEAAVWLAHRLMEAGRADGVYVALPTQATANGMFPRIGAIYRRLFAEEPSEAGYEPSLALTHSGLRPPTTERAARGLSALASEPRDEPYDDERNEDDAPEDTASTHCSTWISDHRKRALLAHVGVGTVDQALLGVLPCKHSPLRVLGLHRKVLVIDEVHAYDAYTSRLLDALLEFHAAFGGSAILLSATLPAADRQRLCRAFTRGLGAVEPQLVRADYPLLTQVGTTQPRELNPYDLVEGHDTQPVRGARSVAIELFHSPSAALDLLHRACEDQTCAVWIRNSVDDAIEAYRALVDERGLDPSRVTLFHARFTQADRARIERDVLARFGKESGPVERAGRVVIATQVVEQSLDVDFDVMVSDLAPVDLLLQRAGRLRRHSRKRDGTAIDGTDERGQPVLYVLAPEWTEEPSSDWLAGAGLRRTGRVYPHLGQLWRTQRLLEERRALVVPRDARWLIEGVYGEGGARIPTGLIASSTRAEGDARADENLGDFNVLMLDGGYEHDGDGWLPETKTPTRLGEETLRVRLSRYIDGELVPLAAHPEVERRHAWLLSDVSVATYRVARRADDDPHEEAIAAATEDMPDLGRYTLTVVLEESEPGVFVGSAKNDRGHDVRLKYTSRFGLHFPGDNE